MIVKVIKHREGIFILRTKVEFSLQGRSNSQLAQGQGNKMGG
jgi:hypothetical protein